MFNLLRSMVALLLAVCACASHAVPANPFPQTITQPDGQQLQVRMRGDEYQGWMETADGYTILRNPQTGYFELAARGPDNRLVRSGFVASRTVMEALRQRGLLPERGLKPPPHPEMRRQGSSVLRQQGPLATGPRLATPTGTWAPRNISGTKKLLLVLVTFQDAAISANGPSYWSNLAFGQSGQTVTTFWHDNSYGAISIAPVPHTQAGSPTGVVSVSIARNHPNCSECAYSVEQQWLNAALAAAAPYVNFAALDTNNNGRISVDEALIYFVLGGYDASAGSGFTPAIWAHAWEGPNVTVAGKSIEHWAMNGERYSSTELMRMGVVAHEMGHAMGGLPDLYDIAGHNSGLGPFSVMSGGSWGGRANEVGGTTPVGLDAWSRQYLGWSNPQTPQNGQTATLVSPQSSSSSTFMLMNDAVSTSEYWLVENRPPVGWDQGMGRFLGNWSGGLLVQHIDANIGNMAEDSFNKWVSGSHQGNMAVEPLTAACSLVTSGGNWCPTLLFYSGNSNAFNAPLSNYYSGAASGLSITGISAPGTTMSATFGTAGTAYAMTVTKGGTGGGTVTSSPSGINCGGTCSTQFAAGTSVTLTASAASGSAFAGWSGACSGTSSTCVVSMSAAKSVVATFTASATTFGLSISKSGTGSGTVSTDPTGVNCGITCTANFTSGTNVTLTASAAAGSVFAGWTGACAGSSSTCVVSMTAARSVTATFNASASSFALAVSKSGAGTGTVQSNPAGIACGLVCSASYASGTSVTLSAAATAGSTFTGWSGACSGASLTCTVSMTQARSVTANFDLAVVYQGLTVSKLGTGSGTVTSDPAGVSCGASCSASFVSGTNVTLTAAAASGSTFAGWSGACTGTAATCVVGMTAAKSVNATFNATGGGGLTLGQAVDNSSLVWTTTGNLPWIAQTSVSYTGGSSARSGAITHSQTSGIRTTVTGPGVLSYRWKVSSESGYDHLTFYYDGYAQTGAISGEVNWAQESWSIPAGTHTLEWRYSKDSSVSQGSDAAWLDAVTFTATSTSYALTVSKSGTGSGTVSSNPSGISCGATCSASFTSGASVTLTASPASGSSFGGWTGACSGTAATCVVSMSAAKSVGAAFNSTSSNGLTLGQAVDNTNLSWTTTGNLPWLPQTSVYYTGGSSARSGAITHSQTSGIRTTVTGPGVLSYRWKVSSESGYDYLTFYYDGYAQTGAISGEVNWAQESWTIPAGTHTLEWRYSKDSSVSQGSDAAWLDNVTFTASNTSYTLSVSKSGTGSGTVSSNPSGISCGATCSASFSSGSSVTLTASAASGSTFTGWSGACSGSSATCTVSMTAARSVTAAFATSGGGGLTLGQAVDNTNLAWTTTGNLPWLAQTSVYYTGGSAARSGAITHSQTSGIRTTVTGPGVLSYRWKVSSESGYDYLTFYYDGYAQTGAISGEVNWAQESWTIPAGTHTLEWRYSKDSSVSQGSDAAWLDAVTFTASSTSYALSVSKSGTGSGTVSSNPSGISCGATCSASFSSGSSVTLTASPASGSTFTGWSGACSGSSTTCTVSMTEARNVTAAFATSGGGGLTLGQAVDNTNLSWTTTGTQAWVAQTSVYYSNGSAARSGAITHSQTSGIRTTVTGPGILSYRWKVSSEPGYDYLTFYYDGYAQTGAISGEVNWAQESWSIPAGTHTLEWRYSKDSSVSQGSDRAWLDAVTWTPN